MDGKRKRWLWDMRPFLFVEGDQIPSPRVEDTHTRTWGFDFVTDMTFKNS